MRSLAFRDLERLESETIVRPGKLLTRQGCTLGTQRENAHERARTRVGNAFSRADGRKGARVPFRKRETRDDATER